MLAEVAGVADLLEAVLGVDGGETLVDGNAWVAGWKRRGDAEESRGALEGESDEMRLRAEEAVFVFGVGVRAGGGGAAGVDVGGVDLELGRVDAREKCIEPGYKCLLVHNTGHEHGFGEAGGEEVAVAGLVGGGAVFVFGEEAESRLVDCGLEGWVGREVGGVEREVHGESAAGVGADADWVREIFQVDGVFFGELFDERLHVGGEFFGVFVVPGGEFAVGLKTQV